MVDPTPIPPRQLDLGAAAYFRVTPENPAGNQVRVARGFIYAGALAVRDQFSGLPPDGQLTAGFAPVAVATQRYDLVYLDINGLAQVLQGNPQPVASPVFQGAPGFTLGPDLPGIGTPVAYIFVDEVGAVVVDETDVTELGGQFHVNNDLTGALVDRGFFGAAPTGASDDVSALFVGATPGNGTSERGVATVPPLNYNSILNQANDEITHVTGARVFARVTEAAGVWTASYFYYDASGVETAVGDISNPAQVPSTPTDLRLAAVPEVFSWNDPNRPLFDSSFQRISDQVVGDIPTATPTVQGKALAAANGPAIPLIGSLNVVQQAGVPAAGGPFHTVNFAAGTVVGAGGVATVTAAGGPGPPGPAGPAGPAGPPGPGFTNLLATMNVSAQPSFPTRSTTVAVATGVPGPVRMYNTTAQNENALPAIASGNDRIAVTGIGLSGTNINFTYNTEDFDGATSTICRMFANGAS